MVVMNRCGQPYLASLLLLCGIRRMLGSLDDDAGHFGKSFWMNFGGCTEYACMAWRQVQPHSSLPTSLPPDRG